MAETWLVVGLGNPGREYENTRHNIGFQMVDILKEKFAPGSFKKIANLAEITSFSLKNLRIILAKPLTFMNLSGEAVRYLLDFYKIPVDHLCVIHDDLDLKFAHVKIKQSGSAGGHNGLKNIDKLAGNNYFRIRVGTGKPKERSQVTSYVLGRFQDSEREFLDSLYQKIAENFEVFFIKREQFASEVGNYGNV